MNDVNFGTRVDRGSCVATTMLHYCIIPEALNYDG
jgi:hypothetical protein